MRPLRPALFLLALTLLLAALVPAPARAETEPHGQMLRQPDVSATHVVFVYAGDLWLVSRDGGRAEPLASPPGTEALPRFSPDGATIAFVGDYDGGRDLYVVPVAGGVPHRVTYHPAEERLCDWTPDGRLLFFTNGLSPLRRQTRLFTVPPDGGLPEPLPVPYAAFGAISPDGTRLLYTPHTRDWRTWKRYRGGLATDLWLYHLVENTWRRLTDWEGTDTQPMWHGERVYYLSDAGPAHRLNLWTHDLRDGTRRQVTRFTDRDVRWPAMGPGPRGTGEIVFQCGSALWLLDLASEEARRLEITIPGARPTLRPQRIDASEHVTRWGISPNGKRALVQARGDVWSLPAEHGSPRNLTRTSGTAERDPAWSPDARWVAWFADAEEEYDLYVAPSDGKGEPRRVTRDGGAFRFAPTWSPDSKRIAFTDKAGGLFLCEVATGETVVVDREPVPDAFGVDPTMFSFSHDGRYLAYARTEDVGFNHALHLYDVETGERTRLTSGTFDDVKPVFDRKGDYLYYASRRAFRPLYSEVDTTFVYAGTEVLLVVPLRDDQESPFAPQSDEETFEEEEGGEESPGEEAERDEEDEEGDEDEGAEQGEEDPLSGTWEGTVTGPDPLPPGGIPFTMSVRLEEDGTVRGSLALPMGTARIREGRFDVETGRLEITLLDDADQEWTITATVRGETVSGTAVLPAMGLTVSFEGERVSREVEDVGAQEDGPPRKRVEVAAPGFEARGVVLPLKPGRFGRLAVAARGDLVYARLPLRGADEMGSIHRYRVDDDEPEERTVAPGTTQFRLAADGKHLLVVRGESASIQKVTAMGSGKPVPTAGMHVRVEPRAEWRQVFLDAWRIYRDYFYDPTMHGMDWAAVRAHYEVLLDDCVTREDLDHVIREMISELNVGHAYYWPPRREEEDAPATGLLGVDFVLEDGAYRIARIHGGAAWDADARGPLGQPGVDVREGDYLLAVNGVDVDVAKAPWAAFEGLAGRPVHLTVSAKPVRDGEARDVLVEPVGSEATLRYRAWIERNRRYVEERTDGRVGYVYVPNTGRQGQNELVRQYQSQAHREALIVDERWNGGGQIPSRFVEMLDRPVLNYFARRDGRDWPWPPDGHQGPKCMLVNGSAGSGGDAFPAYFRQAGLGPLVGTRTWGGLVGISGNPQPIDGSGLVVPTFAYYELDGTWGIEGHGVDPDVEVIDDPALLVSGRDPQLDAAIGLMLRALEERPYRPPPRPAYPDRRGMGIPPEDR